MQKLKVFFFLGLTCLIYSCTVQLYKPHASDAAVQQQLITGRKLYVSSCGGCHNLYLPATYSAEKWKRNLDEMAGKAKITEEQKQLILQYLISQP